jgi:hypothetical protein
MESSKDGRLHDVAVAVGGRSSAGRDPLRETLVGAIGVEVAHVLGEQPLEVTVAEDEHVGEALAADAAEKPFADGVCRGRYQI